MYFEGAEKKLELISRSARFRQRDEAYWATVVEAAGAKILSRISSESCDAYLLSESSLFVWDDRVTMITCGRTTLVRAANFLLDDLPPEKVDFLIY
jgi:S-adenosylmethionine decarboxylase